MEEKKMARKEKTINEKAVVFFPLFNYSQFLEDWEKIKIKIMFEKLQNYIKSNNYNITV